MPIKKIILSKTLHQHFSYDPETGILTRKMKNGTSHPIRTQCGKKGYKYLQLKFKSRRLYAHRVIWFLMTGQQPNQIDHINADKLDNRWTNLRNCTPSRNQQNSSSRLHSSKYKGVSFRSYSQKYVAYIMSNYKQIHIGCFIDENDAAQAYNKAAKKLFGKFALLNKIEE